MILLFIIIINILLLISILILLIYYCYYVYYLFSFFNFTIIDDYYVFLLLTIIIHICWIKGTYWIIFEVTRI
jgi:hypothetical protein